MRVGRHVLRLGSADRETARVHLVEHVPTARSDEPAQEVLRRLHTETFEEESAIYVLAPNRTLVGTLTVAELLRGSEARRVGDLVRQRPSCARSTDDQERVVVRALQEGLPAVPVVDQEDRFLGVVPPRALLRILYREHVEDLHRLVGITRETSLAASALEAPPTRRFRHRIPWLLVGLAGSALSAALVARFERILEARITVAFFVPGIVYLADAIGTQTEAVMVRGLAVKQAPLGRLLGGELRTGALLGLAFAALVLPSVYVALGDLRLAIAVAVAVLVAGSVATVIGVVLPWILSQHGKDPAFGSGPVATIIQDVLSLVIYFLSVSLLLRNGAS